MDISLFRDLERLQQTGNFSQAAAMVNLSQPAFSRRVKSLEAWVGTLLVDRSRQPVRLTEAGHQILDVGLQALNQIELERSEILEAQALPDRYVVSFGAQHSIGWRFYPTWLQALEDEYGPILSRLRADDLPNCILDLEAGQVDFVIAYGSDADARGKDLSSISIGVDQLVPVSKPGPDGAALFTIGTGEGQTPFLKFGDTAAISAILAPVLSRHRLMGQLHAVYENSMAGALRMRARAGDGLAWLPKTLVAPDLDAGLLVTTGKPEWSIPLDIRLYRNETRTNHTTRSIWTFLRERPDGTRFSAG